MSGTPRRPLSNVPIASTSRGAIRWSHLPRRWASSIAFRLNAALTAREWEPAVRGRSRSAISTTRPLASGVRTVDRRSSSQVLQLVVAQSRQLAAVYILSTQDDVTLTSIDICVVGRCCRSAPQSCRAWLESALGLVGRTDVLGWRDSKGTAALPLCTRFASSVLRLRRRAAAPDRQSFAEQ